MGKLISLIHRLEFIRKLRRANAILAGTPDHDNLGDAAIAEGELAFLRDRGYRVLELSRYEALRWKGIVAKYARKDTAFFLHGGGNLGTLWPGEEEGRRALLQEWKGRKITLLPQTLFFGDKESLKSSKAWYDQKELTLMARERSSYEAMKKAYGRARVELVPDMVFYLATKGLWKEKEGKSSEGGERQGKGIEVTPAGGKVLLCLRKDSEVSPLRREGDCRQAFLDLGLAVSETDMISPETITRENRRRLIKQKLQELGDARVVVTDRLHGMVFCAIAGTPCLVLGEGHPKIVGSYEWLRDLPWIILSQPGKEREEIEALLARKAEPLLSDLPLQELFSKVTL